MGIDKEKAEQIWKQLEEAIQEENAFEILSLTEEYILALHYIEHPDEHVPAVREAAKERAEAPDADLRRICRVLRWTADAVVDTREERVGDLYRLALEIARRIDGPESRIERARTMYEMTGYDYANGEEERAEQRLNDAIDLLIGEETEEAKQLAGLILKKLITDDTVY